MAETTEAEEVPGGRALSDETILNPHREVKISGARSIVVAPWGMTQGKLVMARLETVQSALAELATADGAITPHSLLEKAWDDVVDIVSLTVGVERADMEQPPAEGGWTFEDLLAVTDAVLDVCLIRSDGSGALPLMGALVGRMNELDQRSRTVESLPSAASGKQATSRGNSGSGSGSRKGRRAKGLS